MKVSKYLTDKQFCGKYPDIYNLYFESFPKKSRPGSILKKKRFELQISKIVGKWSVFWDVIEDKSPQCCFICGFYIRPSLRFEPDVRQPFKSGDICHVVCYNKNIKMDDVTKKLNPKSNLICHIDNPIQTNQVLCRMRVFNDPSSILQHFVEHKNQVINMKSIEDLESYWKNNMGEDWKFFRNKNFLKPTGEPFKN